VVDALDVVDSGYYALLAIVVDVSSDFAFHFLMAIVFILLKFYALCFILDLFIVDGFVHSMIILWFLRYCC
jgi:hypothetical protein